MRALSFSLAFERANFVAEGRPVSNFDSLAEDIFDLIKDRRAALGRLVFHFERGAELLHQLALLPR